MMETLESPPTRRPRRPAFDREKGVETAQAMFHAHGYDAVSIADLTQALEINPPSLYAAYGSKLELFDRALRTYRETTHKGPEKYLRPGRHPVEALEDMLVSAARQYSRDPARLGCLITEAMQADDVQARELASKYAKIDSDFIRGYIAQHAPKKEAGRISDYVLLNLRGLSSYARLKYTQKQLVGCARTTGRILELECAAGHPKA